jgi:Abnormal spindle-like microcephaly-assoc'd, ASPM-SPD-2-Hydin
MRIPSCQFKLFLAVLIMTVAAWAQWTTPTVDGLIASGEYGNNNQLNNAGYTGQTWYMTWDASNLYVGIVNANLSEGAVIYVTGNPQNPPTCCSNADGNLTGFNYDGTDFSSLPFRAKFVTYFDDAYREYRTYDGTGNWTGPTSYYGAYASNPSNSNTREVAIPWSAIAGGGIPSSFVFFGYLTSGGGYVYGQAPSDNSGAFIGMSATYKQYFAILNTANGKSTPPFSLEQPASFSFTPTTLRFGKQALDTTSTAKSATIKNVSSTTVTFTGFNVTGSTDFAISANTCGATLAVNESCKVSVTYTPSVLGAESATLSFSDNAAGSPQTVPLTGKGIAQATLTPTTFTFPKTPVGTTSAPKGFTLKNNLDTMLTGISYSTIGDFSILSSTCGTTLDTERSCTIDVTFAPPGKGKYTGTLTVNDDANKSPQKASLKGTGD